MSWKKVWLSPTGWNLRIDLLNPRKENSARNPPSWMKSARPIILNTGLPSPIYDKALTFRSGY